MRFFRKQYRIVNNYGATYLFTARQLYEQVMNDSKYDYNWIAPAHELVRICKEPDFPTKYAIAIKIAILNCSARIEHRANFGYDGPINIPEDYEAVSFCYNSLYGIDNEEALSARKAYLLEMITSASHVSVSSPLFHPGPTFKKIKENFINSKFEEYISQEKINFKQLEEKLNNEFANILISSEANGEFTEDEINAKELLQKLFQGLNEVDS